MKSHHEVVGLEGLDSVCKLMELLQAFEYAANVL